MSYKTIVTVVCDPELDAPHLEVALSLAKAQDAHLHVLALGIERIPPDAFYAGAGAIAMQGSISEAIEKASLAEAAVKDRLARSDVLADVQRIVAQIGAVSHVVGRFATLSDLVILPQPYGEGRNAEDVAVVEAALFSTRTPVLILPAGQSEMPRPERVVVAWNQSTEALAAVRAGLPILINADQVDLLVIEPPRHQSDYADPGTMLAEMLTRHGVNTEISVVAQTMPKISDVINREVAERGADLVVMGAYGHSRLMEAMLGGTTRKMLEQASVPILMAH